MWKKYSIIVGVLFLILFAVLSKYEDRASMRQLDFAVTVKVQEKIDKSSHLRLAALVDNTMEGATFFASPEFTVVMTLIITGILLYDRKKKRWHWKALSVPLLLILLVLIEIYGKSIVHHPSPPFSMIKHPISIFPANYVNEQFSYPSGHAARAVFLALIYYSLLTIHYSLRRKTIRLFVICGLAGYVFLVSISRIYLGHHWFSDVIGGLLVGGACGLISLGLLLKRDEKERRS